MPLAPFGTLPLGDTLLGQLCWLIRHRRGEKELRNLLQGYLEGHPFAVVSDAFPKGYVTHPMLPLSHFSGVNPQNRKALKKRVWLPISALREPPVNWLEYAVTEPTPNGQPFRTTRAQSHNSINRRTGTTDLGDFAPYTMPQTWYTTDVELDCHLLFDPERIERETILGLFADMGRVGFGRDANIGLGRFKVTESAPCLPSIDKDAEAYLTLAPCTPQGLGFDPERSSYEVFTRFGRHGDIGVHKGNPFKTPLLMARTGAVLVPEHFAHAPFIGQGLGGAERLSRSIPETIHQGFAPVIGIRLPK